MLQDNKDALARYKSFFDYQHYTFGGVRLLAITYSIACLDQESNK